MSCAHERAVVWRDENDDRIRTFEFCTECRCAWYGCFAKRLGLGPGVTIVRFDSRGETYNPDNAPHDYPVWGPVGLWTYSAPRSLPRFA